MTNPRAWPAPAGQVTVAWNPPQMPVGVTLRYEVIDAATGTVRALVDAPTTSAVMSGLPASAPLTLQVRVVTPAGPGYLSPWSARVVPA